MINNEMVLIPIAVLAGLVVLGFWGTMAVHCYRSRELSPRKRVLWLLAIVFGKLLGAGAYYFSRYRRSTPC